jgi:cytochrome c oxidase subunit I+III
VVSRRRGVRSGPDPWGGDTLEWAIPSPPPHYNFAVIPEVRDRYPNWDAEARRRDGERALGVERIDDEGHGTVATTVLDADRAEVLEMPHGSIWPLLSTAALVAVLAGLLIPSLAVSGMAMVLLLAAVAGWHRGTEALEGTR